VELSNTLCQSLLGTGVVRPAKLLEILLLASLCERLSPFRVPVTVFLHLSIDLIKGLTVLLRRKMLFGEGLAPPPMRMQSSIGEKQADLLRDRLDVPRPEAQSSLCLHQLRQSAAFAHQNRTASRHALEDGKKRVLIAQ
jgi:hypothetical protein